MFIENTAKQAHEAFANGSHLQSIIHKRGAFIFFEQYPTWKSHQASKNRWKLGEKDIGVGSFKTHHLMFVTVLPHTSYSSESRWVMHGQSLEVKLAVHSRLYVSAWIWFTAQPVASYICWCWWRIDDNIVGLDIVSMLVNPRELKYLHNMHGIAQSITKQLQQFVTKICT